EFDVTKPSRDLLEFMAKRAPASELAELLSAGREADLKQWLRGRDIVDVICQLPEPPTAADIVPVLRALSPRLYSTASSPRAHPGEAHLTVGAVRYESHGRARRGVASTFLADRLGADGEVKIYIQPAPGFK